jgi:hypothetical protein
MNKFTKLQVKRIAEKLKYKGDLEQLAHGMSVECEHRDVTRGSIEATARIAIAHLRESPKYYKELKKMEARLGI